MARNRFILNNRLLWDYNLPQLNETVTVYDLHIIINTFFNMTLNAPKHQSEHYDGIEKYQTPGRQRITHKNIKGIS